MSTAVSFHLDRFQMREVERKLTAELHLAQEEQRLLRLRISVAESKHGVPDSGPGTSLADVRTEHLVATGMLNLSLQRYVDFVVMGIVPADMGIEFPIPSA